MKKMKKLFALVMALVMSLSLAATAFASDTRAEVADASKGANVKVTGKALVPTIKLKVPSAVGVVLNPYGMKIKETSGEWAKDSTGTVQDKVVSAISNITNLSDVKVKVGVSATATASTGITFAKTDAAKDVANKDKQVYLVLEMITANDENSAATAFATPAKSLVLSTTAATLKGDAADAIELAASTDGSTIANGGVLAFRFSGQTSKTPTTPWSDRDTVGATVTFTFIPQDA